MTSERMRATDHLVIEDKLEGNSQAIAEAAVLDSEGNPLLWYFGCGTHKIGMARRLAERLGLSSTDDKEEMTP